MNWLIVGLCSVVALTSCGCGGANKFSAGLLYDAKVQIGVAKEADAATRASQELADAEQMLAQAESALNAGEGDQAYRLGMRAYLNARLAEATAILGRSEDQASEIAKDLESKLRAADAALRQLEDAEDQLEKLKATPP